MKEILTSTIGGFRLTGYSSKHRSEVRPVVNFHAWMIHDNPDRQKNRTGVSRHINSMDTPIDFNIVIAYEDFDSAKRAERMIARLQEQLYPAVQISAESWKFELIGNSGLRALATDAAKHANMLILALTGEGDLPDQMKRWLKDWALLARSGPVALVMLHNLSVCNAELQPLRVYLQGLVEQGGLDLFWYGEDAFVENSSRSSSEAESAMRAFARNEEHMEEQSWARPELASR